MIGELMSQKILTLQKAYREGAAALEAAGIIDAPLDAWLLLSYVTGVSRAVYYGNPDKALDADEKEKYLKYIELRSRRIPLQHITGEQEFMGYSFQVNENVLIPRQDTETLVEEALKRLKPEMQILDLCTGSGCILISLLKKGMERGIKGCGGTGTDISEGALAVAARSAEKLEVQAEFLQSDLFGRIEGRYDLIVSNPPYIPTRVIHGLQDEVRLHDPYIALDGGEDGLHFYREIVSGSVRHMKKGGFLLFEIGYDQGEAVAELMEHAGYKDILVKKDLACLDRVVVGMYNEK